MGLSTLFKKPLLSVVMKKDRSPSRNRGQCSRSHGIYGNILPRLDELECKLKKIKKASRKAFKDDSCKQKGQRRKEEVCEPCVKEVCPDPCQDPCEREKSVCNVEEEEVCDSRREETCEEKNVCDLEDECEKEKDECEQEEEDECCKEKRDSTVCVVEPEGSSYASCLAKKEDETLEDTSKSSKLGDNRKSNQFLKVPKVEITSPSLSSDKIDENIICSQASQITVHHLSSQSSCAVGGLTTPSTDSNDSESKIGSDSYNSSTKVTKVTRNVSMYINTDENQEPSKDRITSVVASQISQITIGKQNDQSSQTSSIVQVDCKLTLNISNDEVVNKSGTFSKQQSSINDVPTLVSTQPSKLTSQSKNVIEDEQNICNVTFSKSKALSFDDKNEGSNLSNREEEISQESSENSTHLDDSIRPGKNDQCVSSASVKHNSSFYNKHSDSVLTSSMYSGDSQSASPSSSKKDQAVLTEKECYMNDKASSSSHSDKSVNTESIMASSNSSVEEGELSKGSISPDEEIGSTKIDHEENEDGKCTWRPSSMSRTVSVGNEEPSGLIDKQTSQVNQIKILHESVSPDTSSVIRSHETSPLESVTSSNIVDHQRSELESKTCPQIVGESPSHEMSKLESTASSKIDESTNNEMSKHESNTISSNIVGDGVSQEVSKLESKTTSRIVGESLSDDISKHQSKTSSKVINESMVAYHGSELSNQKYQPNNSLEPSGQCLTSKFSIRQITSEVDKTKSGIGDHESNTSVSHHNSPTRCEEVGIRGQASNLSSSSTKCSPMRKKSDTATSLTNRSLSEERRGSGLAEGNRLCYRRSLVDHKNVTDDNQDSRSSNKSINKRNISREGSSAYRLAQKSGDVSQQGNEQSSTTSTEHRRAIVDSKRRLTSKPSMTSCNEKLVGRLSEHMTQKFNQTPGGTASIANMPKKFERSSRNFNIPPLTLNNLSTVSHTSSCIDKLEYAFEPLNAAMTSLSDQTFRPPPTSQNSQNMKYQMKLNIERFKESSGAKMMKRLAQEKKISEKGISGVITGYTCTACEELKSGQLPSPQKSIQSILICEKPQISKVSDLPNVEGFNLEEDTLQTSDYFKMNGKLEDANEVSSETSSNSDVGQNVTVAMLTDVIPHEAGENGANYMMVHCTGCRQVCLAKVLEISTILDSSEQL